MNRLLRGLLIRCMAPEGEGAPAGGGGGGGSSPPPQGAPATTPAGAGATPPAGTTPPATPPAGTLPAESSLLTEGKKAADADGKPAATANDWIPEKYRVMEGEEGAKTLNVEASMKKVAEAHGALEKRAGELGLPPEKSDDYKVTLPEGSKLKAEDLEGPEMKAFRDEAHKAGLTQKQFDASVGAHIKGLNSFVDGLAERGATMAKDELAKDPDWQGDKLTGQLKLAYRTFESFATKDEMGDIDRIGNNPVFLKILARVGKDLGEDRLGRQSGAAAVIDEATLANYMKAGGPYWDATHPDHKKYVDIVTRHHQSKYSTQPIMAAGHG